MIKIHYINKDFLSERLKQISKLCYEVSYKILDENFYLASLKIIPLTFSSILARADLHISLAKGLDLYNNLPWVA